MFLLSLVWLEIISGCTMVSAGRLSLGCCPTWTLDGRYHTWTLTPIQMKGHGG